MIYTPQNYLFDPHPAHPPRRKSSPPPTALTILSPPLLFLVSFFPNASSGMPSLDSLDDSSLSSALGGIPDDGGQPPSINGDERIRSSSEVFYDDNGASVECLVVLCIGLKEGDQPLLGLDNPAFKGLTRREIKPRAGLIRKEICRRASLQGLTNVRPANWRAPKCAEWLEENPVEKEEDLAYIKQEVSKFKSLADAAERGGSTKRQWRSNVPYLPQLLTAMFLQETLAFTTMDSSVW